MLSKSYQPCLLTNGKMWGHIPCLDLLGWLWIVRVRRIRNLEYDSKKVLLFSFSSLCFLWINAEQSVQFRIRQGRTRAIMYLSWGTAQAITVSLFSSMSSVFTLFILSWGSSCLFIQINHKCCSTGCNKIKVFHWFWKTKKKTKKKAFRPFFFFFSF